MILILGKPMRRLTLIALALLCCLFGLRRVMAHAILERADPPPNAALATPPAEIRLWFSEPLEAGFSGLTLLDTNGTPVTLPSIAVDSSDPYQLVAQIDSLPDGLYTVSWRALSAADGHVTQGSYAFSIGRAYQAGDASAGISENVPAEGAVIRWLNFLSMSLAVGSTGFWLFAWNPSKFGAQPDAERRMMTLIWIGWGLLGVTSVLLLFLQASVAAATPLFDTRTFAMLENFLASTRFGSLWIARMALWIAMGFTLGLAASQPRFLWGAFLCGAGVLLTTALFSHASIAPDQAAAIAGDWLHLMMTTLWVGGLVQFLNVLGFARRAFADEVTSATRLVMYFSNYARVAVVALLITGVYAAWLQVGTPEGLLTTLYGRALLVKLVLFAPLLLIAAVNLVVTARGLQAGQSVWVGRLRGLIGAEIALLVGILAAVGVMTSGNPSRGVLAARAAVPVVESSDGFFEIVTADTMHVHLDIAPAYAGTNTFVVELYDGNEQVKDASVRLRFRPQDPRIGESTLVLEPLPDGTYTASGDNLSLTGRWRVRAMVQRPGAFDTVVDFDVEVAPPPPPPAPIEPSVPFDQRMLALLATGLLLLASGGFLAGLSRVPLWRNAGLLVSVVIAVGLVFLVRGIMVG